MAVPADVRLEDRDLYAELFLDPDSDDEAAFEGFEIDIESEDEGDVASVRVSDYEDPFDNWTHGDREPQVPDFHPLGEKTGVRTQFLPSVENTSVLTCFKLFFPDSSFECMTGETNRYARQYLENRDLPAHSRFANFRDVTLGEMKAFIGLIIAMGMTTQQNIQDYWSTNEVVCTPFYPSVFPRDRFLLIMSLFHLSDNATAVARGQPGYTPLQKLGTPYQASINLLVLGNK